MTWREVVRPNPNPSPNPSPNPNQVHGASYDVREVVRAVLQRNHSGTTAPNPNSNPNTNIKP